MKFVADPAVAARFRVDVDKTLAKKVGPALVKAARHNCPVDTGYLRDHVFAQMNNGKLLFGDTASYTRWVHDGTRYMRARKFLLDALVNSAPRR